MTAGDEVQVKLESAGGDGLIRGLVLGEAVSPLCPNHVLLCFQCLEGGGGGERRRRRERKDKDKNLNATHCLSILPLP